MNRIDSKLSWLLLGVLVLMSTSSSAAAGGVEQLAWLAGNWVSEEGGGLVQEVWTQPRAGAMTGMFRLIDGDEVRVLEYLVIADEADGVFYQFKHFRSDYTTWEGEGPPIRLELVESSRGRAVFQNTREVEGQPAYISYLLGEDGRLSVFVGGPPVESGDYDGFQFVLIRQ